MCCVNVKNLLLDYNPTLYFDASATAVDKSLDTQMLCLTQK